MPIPVRPGVSGLDFVTTGTYNDQRGHQPATARSDNSPRSRALTGNDVVKDTRVTANSDRPGDAGRHARRPFPARARLLGVIAALAAVLLAAGCSSSSSSTGSAAGSTASSPAASATAAAGSTAASPAGSAAPGTDIGLTATTIKVGMIADVDTSLAPGLFQKSVNAVKAWASIVNASGGLAGRKVVVDFCDSKLDPNATTNCVIQACQNDFALVGTSANALEDLSDIDGCKDAAGKAIGIPDLAAFAFLPLACDPDTYIIGGYGPYCATAKENPQTYTANIGDARYYTSQFKGLHGVFVYDSDVPTLKVDFLPNFQGDERPRHQGGRPGLLRGERLGPAERPHPGHLGDQGVRLVVRLRRVDSAEHDPAGARGEAAGRQQRQGLGLQLRAATTRASTSRAARR